MFDRLPLAPPLSRVFLTRYEQPGCPTWSESHCAACLKPLVGKTQWIHITTHSPIWIPWLSVESLFVVSWFLFKALGYTILRETCQPIRNNMVCALAVKPTTQLPSKPGIMCLCVVINKATIWAILNVRFPHRRPFNSEPDTAVMMTVVIAAMQTTNRPNDLRQLNNSRSRCCSGEWSHAGDNFLVHSSSINCFGDTAVEKTPAQPSWRC